MMLLCAVQIEHHETMRFHKIRQSSLRPDADFTIAVIIGT